MGDRPLVSIITPTLNQRRYLEATLLSVRGQTYPAIEHIVIDGASNDGSLDVLQREGERGGIRWQSEPDRGMYDAVNKGVALSRGAVLAYLNSDDLYLPWAVEAVMSVFRHRRDVDVVFGDGIKIEERTGIQRVRLFPGFDRLSLANYESLMQPAVFWRRRLEERIGGFDSRLQYVADLDYWLRASAAGARIAHLDEVIAIERIHEERLSSAQADAMAAEDHEMRARHAGAMGGHAGRERAVARDIRLQRWLWLKFLAAWSLRGLPGPWHRFITRGELTVRRRRILEGSKPHEYRRLRNAVVSRLAARILAGPPPVPPR